MAWTPRRTGMIAAVVVAACSSPLFAGGDENPQEALARSLAGELAQRGYPVDLGKLRIEVRPVEEMEKDMKAQQAILFSPSHFDGAAVYLYALQPGGRGGSGAGPAGEALLGAAVKGMTKALGAYYQPGEGRLVFKKPEKGDVLSALADPRRLVAHEMVHAHQDQVRGIAKMFEKARATEEGTRIVSCLIEGEAEAVSLSLSCDLKDLTAEDLSPHLERLIAGEVNSLTYAAGRTFIVGRFREGGWKAVAAALDEPPPSTEQILHPEKWRRDVPTPVTIGPLYLPLVHEDVLGEFAIFRMLLLLGVERSEAYLAAAGWDGDRLRVHRDAEGGTVVLWRTLWDRTLDAEQFEKAMKARAGGTTVRRGRTVDWTHASSEKLGAMATAVMEGSGDPPAAVEEDGKSAAAVEAAWTEGLAKGDAQEGRTWNVASIGIRMPIPDGWEMREIGGMKMIADLKTAAMTGFGPNINCLNMVLPAGKDIAALLEDNTKQFLAMPSLQLDSMEIATVDGVPALHYEFHGQMAKGGPHLHFLGRIFIKDGRQIVVTATTSEALWEKQKPILAGTLEAIRIEKTPVPGGK